MSKAIANLEQAMRKAAEIRPKVGGFPYLAETLRRAGATRNMWSLPACQSLFLTSEGPVMMQGTPLATGAMDVPAFSREALIKALRTDQAGNSTFPEFLEASWPRRRHPLRRRFRAAHRRLLRLQRRGIHRSLPGRRDCLAKPKRKRAKSSR